MGVELGMRVLELERADAHGSILALAPPEALQGTAGIHGCDTRGCPTLLHWNLHCSVGWRREEMGWRRNGKGDREEVEEG